MTQPIPPRPAALADITVLDFTIVMSGPMCTRMLADAGADVVKIESPDGDVVRQRPPLLNGTSTYYASMNCGKRSVVLDLRTDEGRCLARALAARADVVVENFRPGVMKRLGLDYETLAAENPKLIYASISGFGQIGPRAQAPAYAPVIHAASGYETAYNEYQRGSGRPANNGIFIADVLGAAHAFGAVQLALYERARSGRGQYIDVSLMDSVLGMLIYEIQAAQFPPERPRQVYEPVQAADGYVMVAAVTRKNLDVLFDMIGYPQGKNDPRFATVATKEANWPALLKLIEDWTRERSGAECEATLMRAGVPCSRYRSVAEAMDDPQVTARGSMAELNVGGDHFLVANAPFKMSGTPLAAQPRLAGLGENTTEVLQEMLGLSDERVEELQSQGALGALA
ncbi:MAG: carnitine dehydratase [Comamonas sp. SCN 65-56]|uniref:CaiB/BaiF CoA transferase family protein n=1 Tax=uncultured Comamonas sp. TaxID=114710 RepID=UPI00086B1377|nr:CaiB/BaiF CoA-transferase family protein [uncultured Comamonas sp.]ODS93148.1 MAG: carnitine dehydratase [Comamonas sp. SCN 65-56]